MPTRIVHKLRNRRGDARVLPGKPSPCIGELKRPRDGLAEGRADARAVAYPITVRTDEVTGGDREIDLRSADRGCRRADPRHVGVNVTARARGVRGVAM